MGQVSAAVKVVGIARTVAVGVGVGAGWLVAVGVVSPVVMLGVPPQALSMSTNSMRDVGTALLVNLCDHGYEVMKILISSLLQRSDQG